MRAVLVNALTLIILLGIASACHSPHETELIMFHQRLHVIKYNIRQQRISHMHISDGYYDATTWFPNAPEDIEDVQTLSSGKETWTVTVRLDFNGKKDTIPIQERHPDTGQDVIRNYISWHFDLICHARTGSRDVFNVRLSRKDLALIIDQQKDFTYDLLLGNAYALNTVGFLNKGPLLVRLEISPGDACGGTEFLLALDQSGHLSWIHTSNYFPYPGYYVADKFSPDGKQYFSGTTFFTTSGLDTAWDAPEGYVLDALRLDADLFLIAWSDSNGDALPATLICLDWDKKILASVQLNLMSEGLGYQIGFHDEPRRRVIIRDEQDQKIYVLSYAEKPVFTQKPMNAYPHYEVFPKGPWKQIIWSEMGKTDLAMDTVSGEICAFERY